MMIFVFGSNEAGRHGKGAALYAKLNCGAIYGKAEGLQGNSYGIPTKDRNLKPLRLEEISSYINRFKDFARRNPSLGFEVTPVGCGLAGYSKEQIKPMFDDMPENCHFTKEWFE